MYINCHGANPERSLCANAKYTQVEVDCNSFFSPVSPLFPFIGEECICRDWHGCIMSQKIVGLEDVQPYKFSECSKTDYIDALRMGHGLCLLNKPNEVRFVVVVPSSSVELLAGALAS